MKELTLEEIVTLAVNPALESVYEPDWVDGYIGGKKACYITVLVKDWLSQPAKRLYSKVAGKVSHEDEVEKLRQVAEEAAALLLKLEENKPHMSSIDSLHWGGTKRHGYVVVCVGLPPHWCLMIAEMTVACMEGFRAQHAIHLAASAAARQQQEGTPSPT